MKPVVVSALLVLLAMSLPALDAEAKRLGSGGMKRAVPTQSQSQSQSQSQDMAKPAPAPQQAAPTPASPAPAAPPPAVAPKRSWLGPIAGIAAGLGLAALASHFGLAGALSQVMTMLLIGIVVLMGVRLLMRRFGSKSSAQGLRYAGAGAPWPRQAGLAQPEPVASFDNAGFEQLAKRIFIRLQAANDAGDQADLRRFTTPQMYGLVQQELLERKGATQHTEVLQLDARMIDRTEEQGQQVVSVRFWGRMREEDGRDAESFDEVWHLVRPLDGSREWAIAGIQQTA